MFLRRRRNKSSLLKTRPCLSSLGNSTLHKSIFYEINSVALFVKPLHCFALLYAFGSETLSVTPHQVRCLYHILVVHHFVPCFSIPTPHLDYETIPLFLEMRLKYFHILSYIIFFSRANPTTQNGEKREGIEKL